MEYIVTTSESFAEIEEQVIRTLEQQGVVVRRTFSLHSAAEGEASPAERPGYSVLMLYTPEAPCLPLGLITLYEREGQIVIQTAPAGHLAPPEGDVEAELIAALVLGGLTLCGCHRGPECHPVDLGEG